MPPWYFHSNALSFVRRLLDFTHATGSEQVELDTCLLAEEPTQDLHREHGELPPEPPTLPEPVSTASFNGIVQVWSGRKLARESEPRQMESGKAEARDREGEREGEGKGEGKGERERRGTECQEATEARREGWWGGREGGRRKGKCASCVLSSPPSTSAVPQMAE